MSITEIFVENSVMIYELVGLLIMLAISVHVSQKMKWMTCAIVLLLFFETAVFYIERWTQTFDTLSVFRPILTGIEYSTYPVLIILVMLITTTSSMTKKRLFLLLIPEFICVPIFLTSQWTHIVYYFTEENSYQGGDYGLSRLPYYLFGFYAILFLIHNFIYFKKHGRSMFVIAAYVSAIPIVGVVFYLIADSGKDYGGLFTSALLLYYVSLYIFNAKTDPLTSLQNRQSYYSAIRSGSKSVTGVASVDMNDLKYLNDNIGHQAGDDALVAVSAVMRDNVCKGGRVFRVGGDEFMIIFNNVSEKEIADTIALMREKMSETRYECAFGYAMREPGETVEDAIRRSDGIMYENKAKMKEEKRKKAAEKQLK